MPNEIDGREVLYLGVNKRVQANSLMSYDAEKLIFEGGWIAAGNQRFRWSLSAWISGMSDSLSTNKLNSLF